MGILNDTLLHDPTPTRNGSMNRATARAFITAAQTLADATSPHGADWAWIQRTLMRQTTNLSSLRRSLPMPWPLPPGPPVPDTAVDTAAPLLLDLLDKHPSPNLDGLL